jgi:hypothetical protein
MKGHAMSTPTENLRWHIEYAKKEQEQRLTQHLKENPDNTIGSFLHKSPEWQTDSLIRYSLHYLTQLEDEQKKSKTFLQALFRK